MAQAHKILIIEDEQKVAKSLQQGLSEAGYQTELASNGEEGLVMFLESVPDAVILDLNLPGRDGLQVLKTLRQQSTSLPVLILSARDSVEDRVLGLDSGADDYLIKPFAFSELLARLRVIIKRDQSITLNEVQIADLTVDFITRIATRGSNKLNLTPREFDILVLLARHVNQPVTRQAIARDVWQVNRATSLDNVIDVHMMRLRKKVDSPGQVKLIHTLRGRGFQLSEPNKEAD